MKAEHIMQMLEAGRPLAAAVFSAPGKKTIGDAVAAFLANCRGRIEDSTLLSYRTILIYLEPVAVLALVDHDFVEAHHSKRAVSPHTWRKELTLLRIF
jgi:hypothetical protein